jgi:hypothetical protein
LLVKNKCELYSFIQKSLWRILGVDREEPEPYGRLPRNPTRERYVARILLACRTIDGRLRLLLLFHQQHLAISLATSCPATSRAMASSNHHPIHTGPGQPGQVPGSFTPSGTSTPSPHQPNSSPHPQQQQGQVDSSSGGLPSTSTQLQGPPPPLQPPIQPQSIQPLIAPRQDDPEAAGLVEPGAAVAPGPAVPITEQEVGEYREQDRYLPVRRQHP